MNIHSYYIWHRLKIVFSYMYNDLNSQNKEKKFFKLVNKNLNVYAIVVARIFLCLYFVVSKMLLAENLRSLRVMMVIFYFF